MTTYVSEVRTAVYRLYDRDDQLLYVGISTNPTHRVGQHRTRYPWMSNVARTEVEWHPTRPAAARTEARAIRAEAPLHNVKIEPLPAEPQTAKPRPLCGVAEVADLIGATRQYAWQLSKRRDFPEPAYMLSAGHFWWLDDIEAWAAQKGIALHTSSYSSSRKARP